MLSKTSAVVVCSCNHLPVALSNKASSCTRPSTNQRYTNTSSRCAQSRTYASIHGDGQRNRRVSDEKPINWPESKNPTPYEIFSLQRGGTYSKAQFYNLVKLYHPDRHKHVAHTGLSHAVRLERYRLIVAANDILSDPVKRKAYDRFGTGWGSRLNDHHNFTREADQSWRKEPGNPSMNATWEDWERWYGERDSSGRYKKQGTVYMSNEMFVGVIFLFMVVGGFGQAQRAGSHSASLVEMREQKHEAASQGLAHKQVSLAGLNKEERVEAFLRQREGWSHVEASSNLGTHRHSITEDAND